MKHPDRKDDQCLPCARQLHAITGQYLRAAEQHQMGAIRVMRIGEDMHGIIWRVESKLLIA